MSTKDFHDVQNTEDPTTILAAPELRSMVAMKLPPFWQNQPKLWFARVEAQFRINNVKDDVNRFDKVISELDVSVLDQVADIIESPPENGKYETLKSRLLASYDLSEEQRTRDQRPSQQLRSSQSLIGSNYNNNKNPSTSKGPKQQRKPESARIGGPRGKYVTHDQILGGKIKNVSSSPPDIASQPWNHITLVVSGKAGVVTVNDLAKLFWRQLDPAQTMIMRDVFIREAEDTEWILATDHKITANARPRAAMIRIHSVRAWNLSGGPISLAVYDPMTISDSVREPIMRITDAGGRNSFSCAGYMYSMAQIRASISIEPSKANESALFETTSGQNDTIICYVTTEWRTTGPYQPPTLISTDEVIRQSVSQTTQKLQQLLRMTGVNKQLDQLVAAQPDNARNVDGIVTSAASMLPLVLDPVAKQVELMQELVNTLYHNINKRESSCEELNLKEEDTEDEN